METTKNVFLIVFLFVSIVYVALLARTEKKKGDLLAKFDKFSADSETFTFTKDSESHCKTKEVAN